MDSCYVYVDGRYVRKQLSDAGLSDEFDPRKPAGFVRNAGWIGGLRWDIAPVRVFYYDAVDETPADEAARLEADRQRAYFDRLRRLPETHVVTGYLRPGRRGRRQQKGVDVQLAVDALEAALYQRVKAVALVAGDADFIPLAEAVRRAGPHVLVLAFESSLSDELHAAADRFIPLPEPPQDWLLRP
jgi:uncharacterized LabA/DUF88 family protein